MPKDVDLSRLGKRSWVKEKNKPSPERDDTVVTEYSGVPVTGIEELRRKVAKAPDRFELKDMLAFMLYANDLLDEALEVFKGLAEAGHDEANQRLYMGNIYYRKGLLQMALLEWGHVIKLAPGSTEAARAAERSEKVRSGISIANLD